MSERTVYEYAVIRVVPRVEREEFVNVGIALYCRKYKYAKVKLHVDEKKLNAMYADLDIESIRCHLDSFRRICEGEKNAGRIALLDQTERFRWLTAKRSTLIQCSVTHPGMCKNPEDTHQELFEKLIL